MHDNDDQSLNTMQTEEDGYDEFERDENDEVIEIRGREKESFYRKIRIAGGKSAQSLCITLPKKFLNTWNVTNGDYLMVTSIGDKIVVEKPPSKSPW